MVYKYKYNKQEEMFYHLKDDCIFTSSCLLTPNNYSFVNYKRPNLKSEVFYSDRTNDINSNINTFNCASQRNCKCHSKHTCNTQNICLK